MARTQRRRASTAPSEEAANRSRRVRENLPRPVMAVPAAAGMPRPSAAPVRRRRNPFAFLRRLEPQWVSDIISELRKVTWPSFEDTRHLTIVVSIVATVVGVSLGLIDIFFGWAIDKMLIH